MRNLSSLLGGRFCVATRVNSSHPQFLGDQNTALPGPQALLEWKPEIPLLCLRCRGSKSSGVRTESPKAVDVTQGATVGLCSAETGSRSYCLGP